MPSVAERLDAGEDRVAALRVDTDRRLVEDQQPRPVEQADGDVQAALHPAGVVLRPLPSPGRSGRRPRGPRRRGAPAPGPPSPYSRPKKTQVLARAEVRVDGEVLGHVADRCLRRGRPDVERLGPSTTTVAPSRARIPQTIEIVVVLPAPFGPRRPYVSPRRDLEADAVDGLAGPEPLAKIGARQDGLAGRRCRPSRRGRHRRQVKSLPAPSDSVAPAWPVSATTVMQPTPMRVPRRTPASNRCTPAVEGRSS